MLKNQWIEDVRKFHEVFGHPISLKPTTDISAELINMRDDILHEEVVELWRAMRDNDIAEVADAIADIIYIAIGTAHVYGLGDCLSEIFAEVHASNMSKLGEDGQPIKREDGKILKGPNYFKPRIREILNRHLTQEPDYYINMPDEQQWQEMGNSEKQQYRNPAHIEWCKGEGPIK